MAGDRSRGPQPRVVEGTSTQDLQSGVARGHLPPPGPTRQRTSARSGKRPPPQHNQRTPAKSGGEPHPRPSARSGEGPAATTGGEPQPGVAATCTQAPRPGVARSRPPTATTAPKPGVAENPQPQPTQQERRTGRKEPTGDAGEGPNLRELGAPLVTVSVPLEHTQKVGYARDRRSAARGGTGLGG